MDGQTFTRLTFDILVPMRAERHMHAVAVHPLRPYFRRSRHMVRRDKTC